MSSPSDPSRGGSSSRHAPPSSSAAAFKQAQDRLAARGIGRSRAAADASASAAARPNAPPPPPTSYRSGAVVAVAGAGAGAYAAVSAALDRTIRGPEAVDGDAARGADRPAFRVGQVDAELLDAELLELLQAQVGRGLRYLDGAGGLWDGGGAGSESGGGGVVVATGGGGGGGGGGRLADEWAAEIGLALRALLFKLSVWDGDATYGATLQGLRFSDARRPADRNGVAPPPRRAQKALYGLATVLGPYAWAKWEDWLREKEDEAYDYAPPPPDEEDAQEAGPSRRGVVGRVTNAARSAASSLWRNSPSPALVRRLSGLTELLVTVHGAAAVASFLVFLARGRYRTLLDRALGLRLVPPVGQARREVSFEFLNRQLVWHAFTEFLLFALPLLGVARWRRWLARAWRRTKAGVAKARDAALGGAGEGGEAGEKQKNRGELAFLPERTCAICYQDQTDAAAATEAEALAEAGGGASGGGVVGSAATDVTNPYEAVPCGCVYCYVCLATRIEREEDDGFVCLRCAEVVAECRPWRGDVLDDDDDDGARGASGQGKSRRRGAGTKGKAATKTVGFVGLETGAEREAWGARSDEGEGPPGAPLLGAAIDMEDLDVGGELGAGFDEAAPNGSSGSSDSDSEAYEEEEAELGGDFDDD